MPLVEKEYQWNSRCVRVRLSFKSEPAEGKKNSAVLVELLYSSTLRYFSQRRLEYTMECKSPEIVLNSTTTVRKLLLYANHTSVTLHGVHCWSSLLLYAHMMSSITGVWQNYDCSA